MLSKLQKYTTTYKFIKNWYKKTPYIPPIQTLLAPTMEGDWSISKSGIFWPILALLETDVSECQELIHPLVLDPIEPLLGLGGVLAVLEATDEDEMVVVELGLVGVFDVSIAADHVIRPGRHFSLALKKEVCTIIALRSSWLIFFPKWLDNGQNMEKIDLLAAVSVLVRYNTFDMTGYSFVSTQISA